MLIKMRYPNTTMMVLISLVLTWRIINEFEKSFWRIKPDHYNICYSWNTQLMLSITEATITMTIILGTQTVDTTIIITTPGQFYTLNVGVSVRKNMK